MWRRQRLTARACARKRAVRAAFDRAASVATVVAPPAVELFVVVLSVVFPAAAAAAVSKPANASSSPQARIERRKSMNLLVDCKSEAERAGRHLKALAGGFATVGFRPRDEHLSARLMRSVSRG
jgi:hypothetical protein